MPRWAIIVIILLLLSIAAGVRQANDRPTRPAKLIERTYTSIEECEADPASVVCYER